MEAIDSPAAEHSPPGAPPTALIVDDSADMRYLLREVLESAGWRVWAAGSGQRALRMMAAHRPGVVLIDLLMPGMSGFALRSKMLRDPALANIPVIILSAYWGRPRETLDAAAILPKPLQIDRLLTTMDSVRSGQLPATRVETV